MTGAFAICIDAAGNMDSIKMVRSTGVMAYDQTIERAMRAWSYAPYTVDGEDVAACATYPFSYQPRRPSGD